MADSSWKTTLIKCSDLRKKVAAGIEAPKVAPPLPTRTPAHALVVPLPAPIDVPPASRADKRKGKGSAAATSSAAKKPRVQASSPSQGPGEDSCSAQSEGLALNITVDLSSPGEQRRVIFPIGSSLFLYPSEGITPLETLYWKKEVDAVSTQSHSTLVAILGSICGG